MRQQFIKYGASWVLAIFAVILPATSWAGWYNSAQTGDWTSSTTWSPNGVPVSGDGLSISSGHTVTYNGHFTWTSGQIQIAAGGTLKVNGDLTLSGASLQIASGATLIVNGNLVYSGSLSLNGTVTVTGSVTAGSLGATGEISIGGSLSVSGSVNSSANITVTNNVSVSGDFNVSGAITIGGNLSVSGSQLQTIGSSTTLDVGGSVTVSGNLNASGQITVGTTMTVNGDINTSANIDVADDLSVGGSISMSAGLLHVGGDLSVTNQLATSGSSVVDVDGSATVKYLYVNSGLVVIQEDLTLSGQLGSGGTTVVGGDYIVVGNAPTYVSAYHFYVFGSNNCSNGNCSNIENESDWEANGKPGEQYLTSTPSWWEDALSNANSPIGGTTTVCSSTTFSVSAVTANAGDMAANTFEWEVYGGTISSNTGGIQIGAYSGTVDGYTASTLSYYGVSGQTTYTITVNWTDDNFSGAYVAVRQSSEAGCSDGKWSVYQVNVSATVAPLGASSQVFCFSDSHLVSDLVATGSNIQWYNSASGGTALDTASELVSGTYYASQTVNGCESEDRLAVVVTIGSDLTANGTVSDPTCAGTDGSIAIDDSFDTYVTFANSKANYINTSSTLLSNRNAFTIEGWIKFNKSDITSTRVGLFGQNDVIEFGFGRSSSIDCWTELGGSVYTTMTNYPDDSGWHHVAVVGNGTNLKLYIDGALIATGGNSTSNYGKSTSYTAKIGGGVWDSTGGSFNGSIKEVGFWGTALSAAQVATLAAVETDYTGTETGLLQGYNLNEGTGSSTAALPSGTGSFVNDPVWSSAYSFSWSKTGDGSFSASTKNLSNLSEGEYVLTVSDGICSQDTKFTLTSPDRILTIACPPAGSASCFSSLPVVNSLAAFQALGGSWTDSCNDDSSLSISTEDEISTASGCSVTRTYTLSDGEQEQTCTQTFTLTDHSSPTLTCQPDIETIPNSGCAAALSITAPAAADNCSFADPDPAYYYYPGNDTDLAKVSGTGSFTASFPIGTTTIYWTITDDCGNIGSCSQSITVNMTLTDISYDGGSTATGNGSGVKPMQTSTHTYQVDGGLAESGFTYSWTLLDASNAAVSSSLYTLTSSNGGTTAQISFGEALPTGTYTLQVMKDNGCSLSKTLTIVVISNDAFDVAVGDTGDDCQAGPDGTQTIITWLISFPALETEPFQFSYTIKLNGSTVCSAPVTDISFTSSNYTHTGSCATVSFGSAAHTMEVSYTINNEAGVDKALELSIEATDSYQVSEPEVSNNSDSMNAHGVPDTSDIQTN